MVSNDMSWKEFFKKHASIYDENVFTKNTLQEIDFLLGELEIHPGASILDVGCGTGRHAVELAKRGYLVTGVDFSTEMLSRAKDKAKAKGVIVEWVHSDATRFSSDKRFDAAICLCEGAFGLLGSADDALEQPLAILRNVSRCLKTGAKVLFTVLNGFRVVRLYTQKDVEEGRFDPLTISEFSEIIPAEGYPAMRLRERSFVPTELVLLFQQAGMQVLNMWGGTAGNWKRQKINLDEMEIMVVARKH
jgi:ubiquinone/menaquinone biosynthesis C-methylase UbiE